MFQCSPWLSEHDQDSVYQTEYDVGFSRVAHAAIIARVNSRTELVRIKVKRAKHHIDELNTRIDKFFRGGPAPYPIIRQEEAETGDLLFKVGKCIPIPDDIPAIIGDILQNLRTALDHLAWQLVKANGREPIEGQTGFPIAETSKKYEAMLSRKVEGMRQEAIDKISDLKPYGGGNEDLWGLHELNNVDKHRLLFVVGAAHRDIRFDVSKFFPTVKLPSHYLVLTPADLAWPLKDGTELFRIMKQARTGHFDDNPHFTFQIAFGDAEVMKGEPFLPPLHQLSDLIDAIIVSFDALLA